MPLSPVSAHLWLKQHLERQGDSLSPLALGDLEHLGAARGPTRNQLVLQEQDTEPIPRVRDILMAAHLKGTTEHSLIRSTVSHTDS